MKSRIARSLEFARLKVDRCTRISDSEHLGVIALRIDDDLMKPFGNVGDQVCPAWCVGEEVVAHFLMGALVIGRPRR